MSTTFKWAAAWTSRSTVLTTELNALTSATASAVGTAIDNTSNLDEWGACDIVLASLNPTAGAYLQLFLVQSIDGTTYEDPATTSTNPGYMQSVAVVSVTTGSAAKRIMTAPFRLPPGKFKFVLLNKSGVNLGATLNTVTLYTANEQGV